jgi:hypothetical protein
MSTVRWVIALGAAVLVVCLLVLARGQEHHRGDDIGATRYVTSVAVTP